MPIQGQGPVIEGEAVVVTEPIHFLFDVDKNTGELTQKGHPQAGQNIAGKILIHSAAKGGIANHPAIPAMAANGKGPKGLIFYRTKPDMVQGAIAAGIPIMDRFDKDPTTVIRTGDLVRMYPETGIVEVGEGKVTLNGARPSKNVRLAPDEERMLSGKEGEVTRWAMEMLIKEAQFWGAEDLVDLYSAHVGPSVLYVDEWSFNWLEDLINRGGKFRCLTTTNCVGVDYDNWKELGFDEEAVKMQAGFSRLLARMGAVLTECLAPYFMGNVPRIGEHVAWGESNAVVMANSYFGGRANLLASLGAVANAITGKAPRYGFGLDDYRRGNVLVELKTELKHETDWDALGFFVNKSLRRYDRVPVFLNLPRAQSNMVNWKRLTSTLPSGGPSGSLGMCHAVGITPEARTLEEACHGQMPEDKLHVETKDLRVCYDYFGYEGDINIVWIGDANTPQEMAEIARLFAGKKVKPGVTCWVFTNAAWVPVCNHMGITETLKEAGCKICAGPIPGSFGGKNFRHSLSGAKVVCDRPKVAYWGKSREDITTTVRPVAQCVQAAISGKV